MVVNHTVTQTLIFTLQLTIWPYSFIDSSVLRKINEAGFPGQLALGQFRQFLYSQIRLELVIQFCTTGMLKIRFCVHKYFFCGKIQLTVAKMNFVANLQKNTKKIRRESALIHKPSKGSNFSRRLGIFVPFFFNLSRCQH